MEIDIKIGFVIKLLNNVTAKIRIIPYLPSFKRMAANTIDPATGASTWAFGNHKWVVYIGIFTMKAINKKIHRGVRV